MKTILTISLYLSIIMNIAAKPPIFLSYQDSIGQYSFGYSGPMSARSEYRATDGVTRGIYSYVDKNGLIQTAEYEAGKELGFRIKASNLPEAPLPVEDTPEVKAARDKHLQLLNEAKRREESLLQINADNKLQTIKNNIYTPIYQVGILSTALQHEKPLPASKNSKPVVNLTKKMSNIEAKTIIAAQSSTDLKIPTPSTIIQYEPIIYTPEVIAAREAHFKAYDNAARLAVEADLNPGILMQYYRNQADGTQTSVNDNKFWSDKSSSLQISNSKPKMMLFLTSKSPPTNLNNIDLKIDSTKNESLTINKNTKINSPVEKFQSINLIESGKRSNFRPTQNLSSINFRGMDTKLPSLNEFEQMKLKAGAYSTPIEISHISPTNLISILYPSFLETSALQYVYL